MWNDVNIDGNGEWICNGLTKGTLIMVHDGSYNENLDPDKCSAAYIVMYRRTKYKMKGTVVDQSDRANNYRAKLLGALCCLLIVKAACDSEVSNGRCKAYCDNKGVVLHCARSKMHDKLKRK